jgi:hypothetical protein
MTGQNASAGSALLISRSAAHQTFRDALRLFVGRGRRYSVKQVSNGCGIKDRMLEAFMAPIDSTEFRKPDLEEALTLAAFLGPQFTSELLEPTAQGAYWIPAAEAVPPGELVAENAEDNATLTRAAIDGKFDDDEKPDLRIVGKRMMQRGATLAAVAA